MPRHRSHNVEFKHQVAQEFLGGETLHGQAKRHDLSRNLIRVWVEKYEAGALGDDARCGSGPGTPSANSPAGHQLHSHDELGCDRSLSPNSFPQQGFRSSRLTITRLAIRAGSRKYLQ